MSVDYDAVFKAVVTITHFAFMLDDAATELHVVCSVKIEECTLVFSKDTVVEEDVFAALVNGDLFVLLVAVECTALEFAVVAAEDVHNVVGAVEDFGVSHREVAALTEFDAFRTAAEESTVVDRDVVAIVKAQHTVGAVAFVGVTEEDVLKLEVVATDEGEDIDVARGHEEIESLVGVCADGEVAETGNNKLRTVGVFFVEDTFLLGT